ncbi:MAG: DNA repair protein RecO [Bacteroidales bacterium]|nr:DNA repair protein RecO [Bacteroidales bacterium]
MFLKTEAIVLNRIKYTDNSFVVNLFSEAIGKISVLARTSSRKPGAKANLFAPLNIIQTELRLKDTRSVQSISYCELVKSPTAIDSDIARICISQFIAEVIMKMVKEEEQNLQLYSFFRSTIEAIETSSENIVNLHIIFLKEFASHLGFAITNNFCSETPYFNSREGMFLPFFTSEEESFDKQLSQAFSAILAASYETGNMRIPYAHRKEIIRQMLEYYKIHTENLSEIKSLKVLNEVFAMD